MGARAKEKKKDAIEKILKKIYGESVYNSTIKPLNEKEIGIWIKISLLILKIVK